MQTQSLDTDLEQLRKLLHTMAEKADARVDSCVEAWLTNDYDLAESLRHADDEMDRLDVEVEAASLDILEIHQPRGAELRYVLGAVRLSTQLERMADLARSIAKRVIKHHETPAIRLPEPAREMSDMVRDMSRRIRKAIITEDASLASQVRRADPLVDRCNKQIYDWARIELGRQGANVELHLDVIVLVRALERIGDLCANAAEDVIFIVGGQVVRHTPLK